MAEPIIRLNVRKMLGDTRIVTPMNLPEVVDLHRHDATLIFQMIYSTGSPERRDTQEFGSVSAVIGHESRRLYRLELDFSELKRRAGKDPQRVAEALANDLQVTLNTMVSNARLMGTKENYGVVQERLFFRENEADLRPRWMGKLLAEASDSHAELR